MIVVTSGAPYIDIDAYACCVGYAELLRLQGKDAVAASTSVWNDSITPTLRALPVSFQKALTPGATDQFVLMDVSNPANLDPMVKDDQIIEVFDHHSGMESHWKNRLGDKCKIDLIGAAATLVYEEWLAAGKLVKMSMASAQLLAAAILDNTLNFEAGVTTARDKAAYEFLATHAGLNQAWRTAYFQECQEAILTDLPESLRNDTKLIKPKGLSQELYLGQIVVWDARSIITSELAVITDSLGAVGDFWLANVVSISEGRSYFISGNAKVQEWLGKLLGVKFQGALATVDKLWLRKEIVKKSQI